MFKRLPVGTAMVLLYALLDHLPAALASAHHSYNSFTASWSDTRLVVTATVAVFILLAVFWLSGIGGTVSILSAGLALSTIYVTYAAAHAMSERTMLMLGLTMLVAAFITPTFGDIGARSSKPQPASVRKHTRANLGELSFGDAMRNLRTSK